MPPNLTSSRPKAALLPRSERPLYLSSHDPETPPPLKMAYPTFTLQSPRPAESITVMQMPKKFRIAAASVLLLVTALTLMLEHLHIISSDWSRGTEIFTLLAVCALTAYFEYRST